MCTPPHPAPCPSQGPYAICYLYAGTSQWIRIGAPLLVAGALSWESNSSIPARNTPFILYVDGFHLSAADSYALVPGGVDVGCDGATPQGLLAGWCVCLARLGQWS